MCKARAFLPRNGSWRLALPLTHTGIFYMQKQKKFAAVEKKIMAEDRTRIDDEVSGDEGGDDGAYDSDLDRELEADAEAIARQEPADEHKRLTVQDRARADAMVWSTQVLPPSDFVPMENSEYKPEESVGLDFVHGFRGWDCLSNLHYTITDEMAYFAAGLGIVYESKTGKQKHYNGPSTRTMKVRTNMYASACNRMCVLWSTFSKQASLSISVACRFTRRRPKLLCIRLSVIYVQVSYVSANPCFAEQKSASGRREK